MMVVGAFAAYGCSDAGGGSDGATAVDAADAGGGVDAGDDGGALAFGATCTLPEQCASGVCFTFGDGTQHCSQMCSADDACPEGTQGRKCNGFGHCAN
jgi:hypothetical protein